LATAEERASDMVMHDVPFGRDLRLNGNNAVNAGDLTYQQRRRMRRASAVRVPPPPSNASNGVDHPRQEQQPCRLSHEKFMCN